MASLLWSQKLSLYTVHNRVKLGFCEFTVITKKISRIIWFLGLRGKGISRMTTILEPYYKKRYDGGGGDKIYQLLLDVIYGRPQKEKKSHLNSEFKIKLFSSTGN
jgi:hypothetical protein